MCSRQGARLSVCDPHYEGEPHKREKERVGAGAFFNQVARNSSHMMGEETERQTDPRSPIKVWAHLRDPVLFLAPGYPWGAGVGGAPQTLSFTLPCSRPCLSGAPGPPTLGSRGYCDDLNSRQTGLSQVLWEEASDPLHSGGGLGAGTCTGKWRLQKH
jgi:hypothetical protein